MQKIFVNVHTKMIITIHIFNVSIHGETVQFYLKDKNADDEYSSEFQ